MCDESVYVLDDLAAPIVIGPSQSKKAGLEPC